MEAQNSEVKTSDDRVTGIKRSAVIGLITGGIPGLFVSPAVLYALHKKGISGATKWWIWAVCGVVVGPICWGINAVAFNVIDNRPTTPSSTLPKVSVASATPSQPFASAHPSTPEPSATPKASTSPADATPEATPEVSYRAFLPPEDIRSKQLILSDPYLAGFLGSHFWVGYTTDQKLLDNGFFVNVGYRYNGFGMSPKGAIRGTCLAWGYTDADNALYLCSAGNTWTDNHEWGIQNDEAIDRLISLRLQIKP